jgi:hypothetical protein
MRIYGLDFTSAPRLRKPITCAGGVLEGATLTIESVLPISDFAGLEAFLARPGPWVAGFDFPFGQPRALVEWLGWPGDWAGYVEEAKRLGRADFGEALKRYRDGHPAGEKQPRRKTDQKADARSPMMWYGVPVGKMFFEGAPRLLRSGVSVIPCRPRPDERVAVEAYPALAARRWIGRGGYTRGYKSDSRAGQSQEREAARQAIVRGMQTSDFVQRYGFELKLDGTLAEALVADPTGDRLDAVLCATQAAWAHTRRDSGWGVPHDCDTLEGWIVDPELWYDRALVRAPVDLQP